VTRAGISPERLDGLAQPTPSDEIKTRPGPNGKPLSYIDARYVMDTLDGMIGPENWRDEYVDRADGSVRCGLSILVDGEWVTKWDVGDPSDIEATLGSYSHAFKRAGVKWGIARDLYGHATTSGRAAAASSARPAPAPRPVAVPPAPAAGVPEEPEYLVEAIGAPTRSPVARVSNEVASTYGFCPDHGLAWVLQPGGLSKTTGKAYDGFWKCPSDVRPWCKQKPNPKWAAMHEVAS
jgi:hypothetical protein